METDGGGGYRGGFSFSSSSQHVLSALEFPGEDTVTYDGRSTPLNSGADGLVGFGLSRLPLMSGDKTASVSSFIESIYSYQRTGTMIRVTQLISSRTDFNLRPLQLLFLPTSRA